ncbi:hypothetical protein F4779DRAFT_260862 [Xylariaceae sp. FL0662B]|nr:hypothetical protein F4779DRAFT_260862 [Xylariaceae sp. FL0662B]
MMKSSAPPVFRIAVSLWRSWCLTLAAYSGSWWRRRSRPIMNFGRLTGRRWSEICRPSRSICQSVSMSLVCFMVPVRLLVYILLGRIRYSVIVLSTYHLGIHT